MSRIVEEKILRMTMEKIIEGEQSEHCEGELGHIRRA